VNLFICAKDLFVEAKQVGRAMLLLAASPLGASGLAVGSPWLYCKPELGLAYYGPLQPDRNERTLHRRQIMKLILIVLGLLATTGVIYAACIFC
jgi:hypothetical protein